MPVFNLKVDSLYQQWWRDYYEVEAETQEEAIQLILDEEVDAVDSELLIESINQILPNKPPKPKVLLFLTPQLDNGKDIIAPSGKF